MKIAIFTGPTGGHFYPALAFAEIFRKRHPQAEILFVTGRRGRPLTEKVPKELSLRFEFITDCPLPRPDSLQFFVQFFKFLLKLGRAFLETEKLLTSFKPELSIGFGSYSSFPGMVLSRRRRIPTLIHEQNRKMGRANAWLARRVNRLALSFPSVEWLPLATVTGVPLRSSLVEAATQRHFSRYTASSDKISILVMGGSQGSRTLNELWARTLALLSHEEKSRIVVTHITGEGDWERFQKMYPVLGVEAKVFRYHEKMEEIYPHTDIAVTRAGAGTLFELALFGLPALVFPYPHADRHQEENAQHFEREGALLLLSEERCKPEEFKESLLILMRSPELRRKFSLCLHQLVRPRAAEELADLAEELIPRREGMLT